MKISRVGRSCKHMQSCASAIKFLSKILHLHCIIYSTSILHVLYVLNHCYVYSVPSICTFTPTYLNKRHLQGLTGPYFF